MSTSASKSEASTSSSSTSIDKRIAADGGAIVLGDGSKLETVSDDIALGAIDAMLKTTVNGMALTGKVNDDALAFAKNITGQSNALQTQALDTIRESNASATGLMETTLAAMQKNTQPASTTNDLALKIGAGIAVAGLLVTVIKTIKP